LYREVDLGINNSPLVSPESNKESQVVRGDKEEPTETAAIDGDLLFKLPVQVSLD